MSESIKQFFESVDQVAGAGERVAVATIARTRGSTPREAGAKMIIRSAGQALGTIGGGCGEAEVWQRAMEILEGGAPGVVTVDLTEPVDGEDKICGGVMDIFVERIDPQ